MIWVPIYTYSQDRSVPILGMNILYNIVSIYIFTLLFNFALKYNVCYYTKEYTEIIYYVCIT